MLDISNYISEHFSSFSRSVSQTPLTAIDLSRTELMVRGTEMVVSETGQIPRDTELVVRESDLVPKDWAGPQGG